MVAAGKSDPAAKVPEPPKDVTETVSGLSIKVPSDWYAIKEPDVFAGSDELTLYSQSKETVEATEKSKQDTIPRIELLVYPLKKTPPYVGERNVPITEEQLKAGFTANWGAITGTTPVEDVTLAGKPFVKMESAKNAVDANFYAAAIEGHVVEIAVIGKDFKDSEQVKAILDSMTFDIKNQIKEE